VISFGIECEDEDDMGTIAMSERSRSKMNFSIELIDQSNQHSMRASLYLAIMYDFIIVSRTRLPTVLVLVLELELDSSRVESRR
jgi:hypothetical protein